jgi:hypothetical protein
MSGHRTTTSHRFRDETGNLVVYPQKDISVIVDPRHIAKERLFCPCFKLWPRKRHLATLWLLARKVFICWIETGLHHSGLHWLHASDAVEALSEQNMCNWLGTILRCLRQAWNIGALYEPENEARGFVTCTEVSGFTQPVLSPISNPYYLLDLYSARRGPGMRPTSMTFTM